MIFPDGSLVGSVENISEGEEASAFIKPPFGYFGAKQRIARRIIEMLPPHNAWAEVFCGSAVVTLNKARSPIEVMNDLDSDIVNVFRVLRDSPDELMRLISLTPYSREEFHISRGDRHGLNPLEKARRFLVATMMTVNGSAGSVNSGFSMSNSYARGGREARVNRWYQLPERLEAVVERLRSVRIENIDAREMVRQFSQRPATLLYLDPPYLMERLHTYATDANVEQFHRDLLQECIDSKCMIIVSGYQNALYDQYLNRTNGWSKRRVETKTRGVEGIDIERTELLWVNEQFRLAKKKGAVPVTLTKSEAKEKKVNPVRSKGKPLSNRVKKYSGVRKSLATFAFEPA